MLKRAGQNVTPAAGGIKTIAPPKNQQFDLVVTDILMSEGDGTEVMIFLAKMPNRRRVVAISGGGLRLSAGLALQMPGQKRMRS
jgi:two-component system cell cycle response regulator CpdR